MKQSIIRTAKSCFFCGRETGLERHHAMHGTANRKLADQDGLTVYLCHECHRILHDTAHPGKEMDTALKQAAEYAWIKHYGKTIDDFRARYGKNFL